MGNTYFDFKKFSIEQSEATFKVGTDGCLLGAWINAGSAKTILDIGTGTGLIALQIAQKSNAFIEAIDIDPDQARLARFNTQNSEWHDRINVHHTSLQAYVNQGKRFDLMVCNPPFFKNSTLNASAKNAVARHNLSLDLAELFSCTSKMASQESRLALVLPFGRKHDAMSEAFSTGWHIAKNCTVVPFANSNPNRILLEFSRQVQPPENNSLILYSARDQYSQEAKELLKPYYLNL